jgi:protein-disulfide isomerase
VRFALIAAVLCTGLALAQDPAAPPAGAAEPQTGPALPSRADVLKPQPGDKTLGDPAAPVVVVEYASTGCGHCAAFHAQILPQLKSKYIETGKVFYVFRDFPLDDLAAAGSVIARCMPEGRYWDFLGTLFARQSFWRTNDDPLGKLKTLAAEAGLDNTGVDACLADQKGIMTVIDGRQTAMDVLQVNSTPTLFINGVSLEGPRDFDDVESRIAPFLPAP